MAILAAIFLLLVTNPAEGQRGFFGGSPAGSDIVPQFDADGDGVLNDAERKEAREYLRSSGRPRGATYEGQDIAPHPPDLGTDLHASAAAAPRSAAGLYDEGTLRTLFLRFPSSDWYAELADFYGTEVDVPADLVVDGKLYPGVGVRFRGNSSYQMTGSSLKKSFNISVDYRDDQQRLLGYRTLNLLNAANDPSLVREVLYDRIARAYLPAPKANFVKLVVNGESWGIYVNVQQFNNDFVREWFATTEGVRWKVPAGGGGGRGWGGRAGFTYLGADPESYRGAYELRSAERAEAWRDIARLSQVLAETPDDRLETELSALLDIDGALWFLAMENVFIDGDGYLSRASDFSLYQDTRGRFHLIPYDSNETFRWAGGGGGPNSWGSNDPQLSPVAHQDSDSRPLVRRLLSLASTRARYLAHVRTIVEQWLDWSVLEPIVRGYHELIDAVAAENRQLYSYDVFKASLDGGSMGTSSGRGGYGGGTPSLKSFVTDRRAFLLAHAELRTKGPAIASVSGRAEALATESVTVTAELARGASAGAVLLHWAATPLAPFTASAMSRGTDGRYTARIPPQLAGSRVRYYVEARSIGSAYASTFWPAAAESGALSYRVRAPVAESTPVVINEILAARDGTPDWIELANTSDRVVDLAGMHLSDDPGNPRRWTFPAGTLIPAGGYLVVQADGGASEGSGLHAGFKLSASGETVLLVDTDARGNRILDSVTFTAQAEGASSGRLPDGTGGLRSLAPTPGKPNRP